MRNTNTQGNFTNIRNQKDGSFCVTLGYCINGEDTVTDRKVYNSEKMAISRAEKALLNNSYSI